MELGAAFRRLTGSRHSPRGGGAEASVRRAETGALPTAAYTDLAGLFVGDGVIDDDLIGVLLDPSQDRDDALLALAAGRRAEASGHLDLAIEQFRLAIEAGRTADAEGVVAHAAHDCARALFIRNQPGDDAECLIMLGEAHAGAGARGMRTLRFRIEELEVAVAPASRTGQRTARR